MMYQVSILAAFIAGMVALFAPCCISYLFPAYLGSVFKEKRRILFMTLIYSLGIFVVMLPVVLGAKALSTLFFRLHDQTYIVGGAFMVVVAFLALLGVKLPLPRLGFRQRRPHTDIISIFTLGIFSGITSACCAPVLIGVVALSSLSPTMLQSLGVGAAYVFGMVTPLYLASLFIDKGNLLGRPMFRKTVMVLTLGTQQFPIFISNIVAFVIFFLAGSVMLVLTMTGKLGMSTAESAVIQMINRIAFQVTDATKTIPFLNVVVVALGLYFIYKLIQYARRSQ